MYSIYSSIIINYYTQILLKLKNLNLERMNNCIKEKKYKFSIYINSIT